MASIPVWSFNSVDRFNFVRASKSSGDDDIFEAQTKKQSEKASILATTRLNLELGGADGFEARGGS